MRELVLAPCSADREGGKRVKASANLRPALSPSATIDGSAPDCKGEHVFTINSPLGSHPGDWREGGEHGHDDGHRRDALADLRRRGKWPQKKSKKATSLEVVRLAAINQRALEHGEVLTVCDPLEEADEEADKTT